MKNKFYLTVLTAVLIILAGFTMTSRNIPLSLNEAGISEVKVFEGNSPGNQYRGTLWETGSNMPGGPRYYGGYSTFTRNDTSWLYITGGDTTGGGVPCRTVRRFNFRTQTWSQVASMPGPLRTHAQVTAGNSIFTFGGQTSATSNGSRKVYKYDINLNQWSDVASLPDSLFLISAVVLSDSVIALAGGVSPSAGDGFSETQLFYLFSVSSLLLNPMALMPFGLANATILSNRESRNSDMVTAYVIGGFKAGSTPSPDVLVCNINLSNPPSVTYTVRSNVIPGGGLARHTAIMLSNGSIIISGGTRTSAFTPINNHYLYEPVGNTFTELGPSIYPLCAHYMGSQQSGSQVRFMITGGITTGPQLNATTQFCTDSILIGITPVSNAIPESFSLSQNYPNPFNPVTKIRFDVPSINGQSSNVQLKIFDVTGREVTTLVNEELKAGVYEADWNAVAFSSGIYFYRLTSEEFSETRKMILVK